LDDPHAEAMVDIKQPKIAFKWGDILEAQNDSGLAGLLGLIDVRGFLDQTCRLAFIDQTIHVSDALHGFRKVLIHGYSVVGGGDTSLPYLLEILFIHDRGIQRVDHDAFPMKFHGAILLLL
jgi:hypothetical protein